VAGGSVEIVTFKLTELKNILKIACGPKSKGLYVSSNVLIVAPVPVHGHPHRHSTYKSRPGPTLRPTDKSQN
jgi:hypothetical protein